ncbi:hypothetical protein BDD43_5466 [Mucilaginibacter gracilis]|uniref:Uncharacterized protein n=1 Tax=Mucilaginibacter gracilis TaxID=423350 RepID=A0A495J9X8_9SPHI|nr:hypothetical protein [Mucilaginibacter gracilis]RKR85204.1 hypothetical protein BDD43_5466 [Mucilaginibacter gracilis]
MKIKLYGLIGLPYYPPIIKREFSNIKFSILYVRFLAILLMAAALQGCGPGQPGVYKNEAIKSSKRDEFHKLNNQLLDAIKANKVYAVEDLLSKELLANDEYKRTVELANVQSQLGNYLLLDEYYIVSDKPSDKHKLDTKATDGTRYKLYCATATEEMYIAFMAPKNQADKYMLTVVYCKYNYGWRINNLELQPYTIMGKTAPELYKIALKNYNKGYNIDAFTYLQLADKCAEPSRLWQYEDDSEITAFRGKLMDFLNKFHYPLVISGVPTNPKIFEITHQTTGEGVFPAIHYISSINVRDTTALKRENENIIKVIGKMFNGIDKDKKYIFFSAYNQMPTSKASVASFDMTANLTSK